MIRPYVAADLQEVMQIGNQAWRDIYRMFRGCLGDELFARVVPDPDTVKGEQLRAHCQSHPDWVLICEEGGRVCGFVTYRLDRDLGIGEIGNNAVLPELRGQGLAQQLYAATLDRFRQAGLRYAKVRTGLDPAHAPARRAYEKAGFCSLHEDVDYYQRL